MIKLGATGAFPEGKLNKDDEGELQLAVSRFDDVVRIDFGKPVIWLAMQKHQAKEFAAMIMKAADDGREN